MDPLANKIPHNVVKTTQQEVQSNLQVKNPDIETSPIYTDEIGSKKNIFDINTESILKGIIFSEILGKPKSKRIGR